jgi:outer membrane receptor protein involved in Fe transport
MKRAALFTALFCFGAARAEAQSPLDTRITLHARDVALRDALDRVALLAGVRLSYSGDHLPLDRRVSVSRDSARLEELLGELVRPFAVVPVAITADHVVLTPRVAVRTDSAMRGIAVLDRVVVTGSVVAASERPLPIALDVVRGQAIERREESTLSRVFSGSVPGVWMWEHTPSTMLARYGSVRGASSFGLTFPKVYIDGIEVANPLLLTQISPELVERVEVIRGPQGAALYGSDAISGVVNIISRHEGVGPDGTRATIRSTLGATATRYASSSVGMQEHALSLRGGSSLHSGGVSVSGATSGQYVPHAYSRELRTIADARLIGERATLTANARFFGKNAGIPDNPLLRGLRTDAVDHDGEPQKLRMYSVGSTLTLAAARWAYTMIAGLDGYSLTNVSNEQGPVPSVADTALRAASGAANRGTLRASALTSVGAPERLGASFTFSAENSTLWDRTLGEFYPSTSGPGPGSDSRFSDSRFIDGRSSNTGLLAQTTVAVLNSAYLSAGVRRERIDQTPGPSHLAWLPMLGAALVHDFDRWSIKWRGAYGRGIRAPRSSMHVATREPRSTLLNPALGPEEQSGVEVGADIRMGRNVGVHVTRFDQVVSGLIQSVTVTNPAYLSIGPKSSWYQLQNVGEIGNKGWEAQLSMAFGALDLGGAATFVDSRVRRLSAGYTGDMEPGDRMLAVPARTLSGTVSWVRRTYQASATVSRASDWINYDRLQIARALIADSLNAEDFTGRQLRRFWASYPGTTRLRASVSRDLWRGLAMSVTGENLLGDQRGEPDTITIVPGRTISAGVRARF